MDNVLLHPAAWPQEMEDSIAIAQGRMVDPELEMTDAREIALETIRDAAMYFFDNEGRSSELEAAMQEFI